MKWFEVDMEITEHGQYRNVYSQEAGNSEEEVRKAYVKALRKAGWLTDDLTKFKLDVKLNKEKTKYFDDNGLWKEYIKKWL